MPDPESLLRASRRSAPAASLGRGVFTSPYTDPSGAIVLVAIDASGRRRFEGYVLEGQDPTPLVELLWSILDTYDPPPPPLSLVA